MSRINESAFTGATSEVLVELDLLRRGITPSRPIVPSRYDVLADDGKRVYRVQTKTGRIDARTNTLKASFETPYTPDEVDVIAVVHLDADVVYYVPSAKLVVGTTNVTIRFEPAMRETTAFDAEACASWPYRVGEVNECTQFEKEDER